MATTFAVPDGRVAMAATTYTGNATAGTNISNAVNAIGMQPDFVWIKNRSGANDHILTDSVRGVTKTLISNSTSAELTIAGGLTAFNSGGFQIGYDGTAIVNATSNNYVGWQWNAGGTTVTNGTGTISSQVRANTTAGFSVVTYTGTGANATVGHGLGVAPSLIIGKGRGTQVATSNWATYHVSLGNTQRVWLDLTANATTNSTYWNNTSPTTTTFSLGSEGTINGLLATYVAYCWAPVAGYSAFGSYTGNGSSDGPFIYTGFRPRFVLIKASSASGSWFINDTSREPYNLMSVSLRAETADPEATGGALAMDALSNGFKMRDAGGGSNGSGVTYIYAAFAENPLKFSNAR